MTRAEIGGETRDREQTEPSVYLRSAAAIPCSTSVDISR